MQMFHVEHYQPESHGKHTTAYTGGIIAVIGKVGSMDDGQFRVLNSDVKCQIKTPQISDQK